MCEWSSFGMLREEPHNAYALLVTLSERPVDQWTVAEEIAFFQEVC
ncbi:hypothetical protein HSR121_1587 [Halapricum desulfuricans]|uniref:Uncharacterized protein n=1 Tax=Halapricum desulfuricans TaxID=2841257 RepID=A0A897N4W4_9EURY|nr:hypothetical protein HSR121_1587 [Halapricum desulfuricans]